MELKIIGCEGVDWMLSQVSILW